ncbi:hypothetical protein VNI00_007590 [Paramarasmius palmivorus]|uniref:Uncharacterized protein n=1 Tax=Paramarasmius palmivorus TaxID=297713 RepID=A0AAW0CZN2_9AGAR
MTTTTSSLAGVSEATPTDSKQPTIQILGSSTPDESISSSAPSSTSTSISVLASSDTTQATTDPPSTMTHGNTGCQHHQPSTTSNTANTLVPLVGFVLLVVIAALGAFYRLRRLLRLRRHQQRSIDALEFNRDKMVKGGGGGVPIGPKVRSDSWESSIDSNPWSMSPPLPSLHIREDCRHAQKMGTWAHVDSGLEPSLRV